MPGLYVHIPFCSIKCFYCDFAAFSGQGAQADRYLKALDAEAALYPGFRPDTLYIGGGTPSELDADQLRRLLSMLSGRFGPLSALREATCEGNPESLDEAKLAVLKDGGVGRLSLGLQTPYDDLLKAVGRKHDWADFRRVYAVARARDFNISIDLMFGLPGQTLAQALDGLKLTLDLGPQHISLYSLQVEDRTLFGKREVEVDEDLARSMMEGSLEILAARGFRHYEISNFALPGKESLHNLNYWQDGEYLGLGCSAAGFLGGERYQNEERLQRYLDRVERGERPVASGEKLEGKAKLGESVLLGLRRIEGMELTRETADAFAPELSALARRGLIERGPGRRARLSREGIFVANEVFREFVPPFIPSEEVPGTPYLIQGIK